MKSDRKSKALKEARKPRNEAALPLQEMLEGSLPEEKRRAAADILSEQAGARDAVKSATVYIP